MLSTFKVLLGELDWSILSRVGRLEAGVWYCTTIWFLNFVMLNMLLGIVLDVYSSVNSAIPPDAETVFSQLGESFSRWLGKRRGQRMSLLTVLSVLLQSAQCNASDD